MWKSKQHANYPMALAGVAILISFSFLALFGLSLSMTKDEHGQMSDCPFMSQAEVICPMQAGEHIARWQQAITGTPQDSLGLVLAVLIGLTCWQFNSRFLQEMMSRDAVRLRLRREGGLFASFNFLKFAFSQGILHPKIYETHI